LRALPQDEILAIVQELAPHLRANVVLPNLQGPGYYRKMVKGLPVFYLHKNMENLPELRPPGDKKKRDPRRPRRKDVRLEDMPFLPAIRAHRYAHTTGIKTCEIIQL
jgi:hypothetical protein